MEYQSPLKIAKNKKRSEILILPFNNDIGLVIRVRPSKPLSNKSRVRGVSDG